MGYTQHTYFLFCVKSLKEKNYDLSFLFLLNFCLRVSIYFKVYIHNYIREIRGLHVFG